MAGSVSLPAAGIGSTVAAVANAVHHATVIRVRALPIRLEKLLV
jgi:CO/xanthine dehydrogenase Mo-binding subunit